MAKQKKFDDPEDDVPAWVMTFSDVITLLMTFFILLLTFATNTPETFDRLQVSMFGGGGATGFVGPAEGMEKDAVLNRMRARTGRMAENGTEIPPEYTDPALESMSKSIAGLEDDEARVITTEHRMTEAIDSVVDGDGKLTNVGKQQLRMLAQQMRKLPLRIDLVVNDQDALGRAVQMALHMANEENIHFSKVGVSVADRHVQQGQIMLIISKEGAERGS